MQDFKQIAVEAQRIAAEHTGTDWGAVAVNTLTILIALTPVMDTSDKSKLDSTAMHDDWLAAVAGLPSVSKNGLRLLAKAVERKGWVSVAEALDFIHLEEMAQEEAREAMATDSAKEHRGAAMLLARAEAELPGTIQRFADGAKDFAVAATGVLAFTAEKTLWVGHGLGTVAGWMRQLRKGT